MNLFSACGIDNDKFRKLFQSVPQVVKNEKVNRKKIYVINAKIVRQRQKKERLQIRIKAKIENQGILDKTLKQ